MTQVNMTFVEQYQKMLEQDPNSRVFAPLAEAYRKMGLLEKALETARKGVKLHPHFSGGHVALGQALLEKSDFPGAIVHLKKAAELSPENILAHLGLARALLRSRKAKEALHSYKMVLFLNPQNEEAQRAVARLESLTADEFEEDLFSMKPISENLVKTRESEKKIPRDTAVPSDQRHLLRKLSLIDAFIARNDLERAHELAKKLHGRYPGEPEVQRRLDLLGEHFDEVSEEVPEPIKPIRREVVVKNRQRHRLEKLLQKVQEWQKE